MLSYSYVFLRCVALRCLILCCLCFFLSLYLSRLFMTKILWAILLPVCLLLICRRKLKLEREKEVAAVAFLAASNIDGTDSVSDEATTSAAAVPTSPLVDHTPAVSTSRLADHTLSSTPSSSGNNLNSPSPSNNVHKNSEGSSLAVTISSSTTAMLSVEEENIPAAVEMPPVLRSASTVTSSSGVNVKDRDDDNHNDDGSGSSKAKEKRKAYTKAPVLSERVCSACNQSLPRNFFPKKEFVKSLDESCLCHSCRKDKQARTIKQDPPKKMVHGQRVADSGQARRPNNFGYCNYIDRLFGMKCFADIVELGVFTSGGPLLRPFHPLFSCVGATPPPRA
jgi:hypothetical protein